MKRFLDSDICRSALKLQSKRSTYFVWCFFGGDALRFDGATCVRCVLKNVCPWMGWFVDEKKLGDNFCRYTKTQSLNEDVLRRLAQIG